MRSSEGANDVCRGNSLKSDVGSVEHRFSDYLRVWPVSKRRSTVSFAGFSVGRGRPWATGGAGLYELSAGGREYALSADLSALAAKGLDTTGQPLLYGNQVLIPVWSSKFYTDGFLGLAIVSCDVERSQSEIRYFDRLSTYGCHFFCNVSRPDELFLGVGKGGGGRGGRIRFTPDSGILLKSDDGGKTWRSVFTIDKASAIYDGVAMNDVVIITSRDLGAVLMLKEEHGGTYSLRKTYFLGSSARNISLLTWKNSSTILVSSDNGFYTGKLDGEGLEFKRIGMPITGFALRYPTMVDDRFLSFIGCASTRSYLLLSGTENGLYYVDLTRLTGLRTFTRMSLCDDGEHLLLGTEMEGCLRLYDTKWLLRLRRKLGTEAWFDTTTRFLWSGGRQRARDMLGGLHKSSGLLHNRNRME